MPALLPLLGWSAVAGAGLWAADTARSWWSASALPAAPQSPAEAEQLRVQQAHMAAAEAIYRQQQASAAQALIGGVVLVGGAVVLAAAVHSATRGRR